MSGLAESMMEHSIHRKFIKNMEECAIIKKSKTKWHFPVENEKITEEKTYEQTKAKNHQHTAYHDAVCTGIFGVQ